MANLPTAMPMRTQGYSVADYEGALRQLGTELSSVKGDLARMQSQNDTKLAPRFIEDIPGKRVPYWWLITVAIDSAISDGARWTGSSTLSQDGPFVITSTRVFWRVTTASTGTNDHFIRSFLPPCKLPFLIAGTSAAAATSYEDAKLQDVVDWFLSIQVAGGGRLWQNSNIPAPVFTTDGVRPEYLGIAGWIERNDTMTIEATATVSTTAAAAPDSAARGTLYVVHTGYKILRPIDYAEAFGMSP